MRFIDHSAPDLPTNLALDEALLQEAEDHDLPAAVRLWELPSHAVVLGASGRTSEDVNQDHCQIDAVPLGRRSSGGGTVVIGPGALNVAVVLPLSTAPGLQAVDIAQRFVLSRLAEGLRDLHHLDVKVLGSGDLVLDNRKFAGSAQRRLKKFFLVHSSLLYNFNLPLITRYTHLPRRQPSYREGRDHDSFVTNLPLPRHSLVHTIRHVWNATYPSLTPDQLPHAQVEALLAAKFADPAWIHRF